MNRSIGPDSAAALPLVIGITSHRNIPAAEEVDVRRRFREFLERLRREFPHFSITVLSSLAAGGDQWAAEEGLAIGARLIAALPMSRAQYLEDFVGAAERAAFERLCARAEIIEVPTVTGDSAASRAMSNPERDALYAQAGVYVSNHCHLLVAIWDGKDSDMLGGTAQIARFHLSGIKPSQSERRRSAVHRLGHENERLMYHIVCSRTQENGTPERSLRAGETWWRVGTHATAGDGPMRGEFRIAFANASEFAADRKKYSDAIDMQSGNAGSETLRESASYRLFRAADWLAIHFQRRVLLSMRALYTMAALMAIAFAVYDNLTSWDEMIYVFLVLFVLGGIVALLANRRQWHRKYLDYRALAEGLRVQSYWHRAGLSLSGDIEFARDNFLQKQDVELGWVRDVMRGAELENDLLGRPLSSDTIRDVIGDWIGDDHGDGQLGYYQRKAAQRVTLHKLTERIGSASLSVGISISVILAVFIHKLSADVKNDLIVVMAVFSVIAGVRSAYAYKKADRELIKQYRYMDRIFAEARRALDATHDTREQRDILRLLGDAALAEQVEWALMQRQRPLEHNRI
jgi:hypothetical protein